MVTQRIPSPGSILLNQSTVDRLAMARSSVGQQLYRIASAALHQATRRTDNHADRVEESAREYQSPPPKQQSRVKVRYTVRGAIQPLKYTTEE
jgi:hypothetical protein